MKAKTILDAEKKDAIDIATELCYSEEVKRKIAQAKSVYEIGRILKQARLDQERYPDGFDAEHSLHRNQDDI